MWLLLLLLLLRQWHQLGHMQVCISLQRDNHASTPPLSFLQTGCPSCCPTNSVKAMKVMTSQSENTSCQAPTYAQMNACRDWQTRQKQCTRSPIGWVAEAQKCRKARCGVWNMQVDRHMYRTGFVANSKNKIQALFEAFQGPKLHFHAPKLSTKSYILEVDIQNLDSNVTLKCTVLYSAIP